MEPSSKPRDVRVTVVALCIIAVSATATLAHIRQTPMGSANPKSRFSTIECLVDHGTYAIDCSPYKGTMDRVKKDGHLYSSKPPMLPTAAAGVYWAYRALTGNTIDSHEHQVVFLCIFFVVFLPHVLALFLFWRFARRLSEREESALLALAAVAFGWLGAGYAVDLNNHTPAALLALGAFYAAYRARHDEEKTGRWFAVAGLCAGLLPTIDIPSNLYSIAAFALLVSTDWRRTLTLFVPAALPPLLVHFALTWHILGGVLPAYFRHELYERKLSEWGNPIPLYAYAFHALVGHHGLFSMTPAVAVGVAGLVQRLRERSEVFLDALAIAVPAGLTMVTYLFFNRNYGGTAVGFRWYIPTALLLLLFVGPVLDRARRWQIVGPAFALAVAVGHFHVENAMDRPWQTSRWEQMLTGRYKPVTFKDRAKVLEDKRKKREEKLRKRREERRKKREAQARDVKAREGQARDGGTGNGQAHDDKGTVK